MEDERETPGAKRLDESEMDRILFRVEWIFPHIPRQVEGCNVCIIKNLSELVQTWVSETTASPLLNTSRI